MALRITTHEEQPRETVSGMSSLDDILYTASEESRIRKMLNGIILEAENGNTLLLVVGSEETVLIFNYGGPDPPYYASKGNSDDDDPMLTCYITFQHHTEFPRRYVIPFVEGLKAARQFLGSDDPPACITWEPAS